MAGSEMILAYNINPVSQSAIFWEPSRIADLPWTYAACNYVLNTYAVPLSYTASNPISADSNDIVSRSLSAHCSLPLDQITSDWWLSNGNWTDAQGRQVNRRSCSTIDFNYKQFAFVNEQRMRKDRLKRGVFRDVMAAILMFPNVIFSVFFKWVLTGYSTETLWMLILEIVV